MISDHYPPPQDKTATEPSANQAGVAVVETTINEQTTSQADGHSCTASALQENISTFPQIPGYRIEKELGRGGMGVVYLAMQLELNRTVAIKMILPGTLATPEQRLRFRFEAEMAARVKHPHVVQVYEVGEYLGNPFFVQEYVEGSDLKHRLADSPLTIVEALELFETLALAVAEAHQSGVVHRDLKPANILLSTTCTEFNARLGLKRIGLPKISDFGLAKRYDSEQDRTRSGALLGTPNYMSPEQAEGRNKEIGPATDVWALGVILYETLTGKRPFHADSIPKLLEQICTTSPIALRQHRKEVSKDLETICVKCLEKDSVRRYPNAGALAVDLQNLRSHRPISARPVSQLERMKKWCRRYPAAAGLVAVSVTGTLIATGLAYWAFMESGRADEQTKSAQNRLREVSKATDLLGQIFVRIDPKTASGTGGDLREDLQRELTAAARRLDAGAIADPLTVAGLRDNLGLSLVTLGDLPLARQLLEQAEQTYQTVLGVDSATTLKTTNHLANAYFESGDIKRSIELLEKVLAAHRRVGCLDTEDVWSVTRNLATARLSNDENEVAIDLLTKLTKEQEAANVVDQLAGTRNILGLAYNKMGRFEEAAPLLEQAHAVLAAKLGEQHFDTLTPKSNLADAWSGLGRHDQAAKLLEEILLVEERVYGVNNINTLMTKHHLANTYSALGDASKARPILETVWEQFKVISGVDHSKTLNCQNSLASLYSKLGQHQRAIELFEDLLMRETRRLGEGHTDVLVVMTNLGNAYSGGSHHEKAIALLKTSFAKKQEKLGKDNHYTLSAQNGLASAYSRAGQRSKAIEIHQENLKTITERFGDHHADTRIAISNTAHQFLAAGDKKNARDLFNRLAHSMAHSPPLDRNMELSCFSNIAHLERELQNYDKSEAAFHKLWELRKRALSPTHVLTIDTENHLGLTLFHAGRMAEAERHLLNSHHDLTSQRGIPLEWPIIYCDRLAVLYEKWGKEKQAYHWRQEQVLAYRIWIPTIVRGTEEQRRGFDEFARLLSQLGRRGEEEAVLRDFLTLLESVPVTERLRRQVKTRLAVNLSSQKKHADAELLFFESENELRSHADISNEEKRHLLGQTIAALVRHFKGMGNSTEAAKWQKELDSLSADKRQVKQPGYQP